MRRPPKRAAFTIIYLILALATAGSVYAAGALTWHPVRTVSKPALCQGAAAVTHCLSESITASGASVVKLSCAPSGKAWACDLEIAGTYGPVCYAVTAQSTREGFPVVETAAEKPCP